MRMPEMMRMPEVMRMPRRWCATAPNAPGVLVPQVKMSLPPVSSCTLSSSAIASVTCLDAQELMPIPKRWAGTKEVMPTAASVVKVLAVLEAKVTMLPVRWCISSWTAVASDSCLDARDDAPQHQVQLKSSLPSSQTVRAVGQVMHPIFKCHCEWSALMPKRSSTTTSPAASQYQIHVITMTKMTMMLLKWSYYTTLVHPCTLLSTLLQTLLTTQPGVLSAYHHGDRLQHSTVSKLLPFDSYDLLHPFYFPTINSMYQHFAV